MKRSLLLIGLASLSFATAAIADYIQSTNQTSNSAMTSSTTNLVGNYDCTGTAAKGKNFSSVVKLSSQDNKIFHESWEYKMSDRTETGRGIGLGFLHQDGANTYLIMHYIAKNSFNNEMTGLELSKVIPDGLQFTNMALEPRSNNLGTMTCKKNR